MSRKVAIFNTHDTPIEITFDDGKHMTIEPNCALRIGPRRRDGCHDPAALAQAEPTISLGWRADFEPEIAHHDVKFDCRRVPLRPGEGVRIGPMLVASEALEATDDPWKNMSVEFGHDDRGRALPSILIAWKNEAGDDKALAAI